ncbi:hypothetical protein CVT25_007504 [Psilocybe cyanescens]|uniref:Uncharacterized protein n=1 Tax=Psilocybe cyanescens TaxID=93625 RepID=A0A409XTC2_PSICY|nr:hypothetical protein CVT25_007504 [Psilocybe cyanescens]
MATVLLDQLQSWGLEREIHDRKNLPLYKAPFLLVPFLPALLPIVKQYNFRQSLTIHRRFHLPPPLPQDLPSLRLHLDNLQKQRLVNEACPTLCQLQQIAQRTQHWSPATNVVNPDTFAPSAPNSSAFTATDTHPDIPSVTVATTQEMSNTLTPIMEELTRIFSMTPEL